MEKSIISQDYALLLTLLIGERKNRNLAQRDVAAHLSKTQSFVSKVERGERRLDIVELRHFCEAVGVPFVDFVQKLEAEIQKQGQATSGKNQSGTDRTDQGISRQEV